MFLARGKRDPDMAPPLRLPASGIGQARQHSEIETRQRIQGSPQAMERGRLLSNLLADRANHRAHARRLGVDDLHRLVLTEAGAEWLASSPHRYPNWHGYF